MIFGISWTSIFQTISQITAAGAAITALSLLLFALIYNLREQVVRAFILILLCVVVFYTAETIASVSTQAVIIEISLKIKWVGIVFLPASYLYFSNALLTLTGRPSRGRRLWLVRGIYFFSGFMPFNSFEYSCGTAGYNWPANPTFRKDSVYRVFRFILCWCYGHCWLHSLPSISTYGDQNQSAQDDLPFIRCYSSSSGDFSLFTVWVRVVLPIPDLVLDYCQHSKLAGGRFPGDHFLFGCFLWSQLA